MRSGEYIQRKFQAWARRQQIALQGSEGERGEPNYTSCIENNIFGGALHPDVRKSFEAGAGGELRGAIPSICALHSSAALAVNLFQHWVANRDFRTLASLLTIPSRNISYAGFERKYPVCSDMKAHGFNEPPHLDFAIEYDDGGRVGVECKLFEPYGRLDHAPLKDPYLALKDAWDDIPGCRAVADTVAAADTPFARLGAAQLLRHILGLRFEAPADKVRLLYLYYDALGPEAEQHRVEIRRFQELIAGDPVRFVPLSVQEFILRALSRCTADHQQYVDYISERYL